MVGSEAEALDSEGIAQILWSGNPLGWANGRFGWSVYLR
jgi:hypothetical protein